MKLEFFNCAHCVPYPPNVIKNKTYLNVPPIVKEKSHWLKYEPKHQWGVFFCNISLVIWLIFDPMKSFIKIIIISKLFNKWTPYLFCKQTWPKSLYFSIGQSNKLIWSKVIVKQKKVSLIGDLSHIWDNEKKVPLIGDLAHIWDNEKKVPLIGDLAHIWYNNFFTKILIKSKLFNIWAPYLFCKQT